MPITTVVVLIISYLLIAMEKWPKVTVAMFGAALMLLLQSKDSKADFEYIDFGVIFLLVSTMIIVHIAARTGILKWLTIEMLKKTAGKPIYMLVSIATLLYLFKKELVDNPDYYVRFFLRGNYVIQFNIRN